MALIFKEKVCELVGRRYDPDYVRFRRRQKSFRYPAVALGKLISARPEYGAAEPGVEREKPSQVRYVRITDIDEYGVLSSDLGATVENVDPRYLLNTDDVLFARSGNTVGKCYCHDSSLIGYPCIYAGYLIRFRFGPDVLPKFVFAFAQTPYFHEWVSAVRRAAGQPNINAQEYSAIEIPLPPLPVQRRLVSELDAAYAAKRAADQQAATLLASIDDMVMAELGIAKLPPHDNSLSARIFMTPLREMVGGRSDAIAYQSVRMDFYRNVRSGKFAAEDLSSLVEVRREQTDDVSDQTYIGLENINGEDGSCIAAADKESCSSAVLFTKGQILFPKLRPYLNKVWLAEFDGVASTEFIPLEAVGISADYLTVFLRMRAVAETMRVLMTGNTLPRVQLGDVLSLPIPVPPKDIQQKIIEQANTIKANAKRLKAYAVDQLAAVKKHIEEELMNEGVL